MSLPLDNKDAAEAATRQLHAFGLVCEVEPSVHAEARAHWRVAIRMPQRQRFEIALPSLDEIFIRVVGEQ